MKSISHTYIIYPSILLAINCINIIVGYYRLSSVTLPWLPSGGPDSASGRTSIEPLWGNGKTLEVFIGR
jgi:hypothetical protein